MTPLVGVYGADHVLRRLLHARRDGDVLRLAEPYEPQDGDAYLEPISDDHAGRAARNAAWDAARNDDDH